MKGLFSLIALFFITNGLVAQVTSFSSEPEKFLEQVNKYLGSVNKRDAKEFVEEFEPVWLAMSASDQSKTARIANLIVEKKLRPYPEFKGFISAIHGGYKNKLFPEQVDEWIVVLEKVVGASQKKRKTDFLTSSGTFFTNGKFYESKTVSWKAVGGQFKFKYDKVAFLEFTNVNLICEANKDSSVIIATSGLYNLSNSKYKGKGGKLHWNRVKLDPKDTYAEWKGPYEINIKSSTYKIDSVIFHTTYFKDPLPGKLSEKLQKKNKGYSFSFPRFESFSQRLVIENVIEDVNYDGGFTFAGAKFIGSGTATNPAKLIFLRKDQPQIVTFSRSYSITEKKISSPTTQVKVILDKDSIYHPGLNMEYIKAKKEITLSRTKNGVGQSPFFDSYHNIDISVEALYWRHGDSTLEFKSMFGSSKTEASFESSNYFDNGRYDKLQGMEKVHPLVAINQYTYKFDQFEFEAKKLANFMGRTVTMIKPMLIELNNLGFLIYDIDNEYVITKQKLFDYVKARSGKKDYDVISFNSDTKGKRPNGILNLKSFNLKIDGVKKANLGARQMTRIFPDITDSTLNTGIVTMFKNRSLTFDGVLLSGNTDYTGKNFHFDYDKFEVTIADCDKMGLRAWNAEERKLKRVQSAIEGVKGLLLIDDPSNKSGINKEFGDYPKLVVTKETFVFYDDILKGVYDRKNFMFINEPFTLDSLTRYSTEGLGFKGILKSAGIFPDINEQLVVQDDYSLGFVRKVPEKGYKLYKDKGDFKNTMSLSNSGLQGDGKIEYITSTSISKAFTFFPDSTNGIVESFVNLQQTDPVKFPKVEAEGVQVSYIPESNVLFARSQKKKLLNFFNNESTLKGYLAVRPEGMTGRGKMVFGSGVLSARMFSYEERKILSDTSKFELSSYEKDDNAITVDSDNVSATVDFDKREGLFKANNADDPVVFPEIQYICYMDEFKWYMDVGDIELQKKSDLTIESTEFDKPNFYSIHPKQDSLSFMAPKAYLDMKQKLIRCKEVPFMDVADARIVPDSGKVIVRKKAKMDQLLNAQILANNVTKNHTIINATVDVYAKRDYKGSGDYFYKDQDENAFKIHFAEIAPDTSLTTYAEGEITIEENFKLSKEFDYHGGVELNALNKHLVFDGETRIAHDCGNLSKNWMKFRSEIDPLEIYIPIDEKLEDAKGNPLGAGLVINPDSVSLYSTFLSKKGGKDHPEVITANGFLHFDRDANEYRISNKEKIKEIALPGNYISLNTKNCEIKGDGLIQFGVETGQLVTGAVGLASHNLNNNNVDLRGSFYVNFPFSNNALDKMAASIVKAEGFDPIDLGKTFYKKGLVELLGKEKAEKIESDLLLKGEIKGKIPSEILKSLFFADVKFKWNKDRNSWQSVGKLGLATINKDQVFKYLPGKIEIQKRRKGSKGESKDIVSIYIEAGPKSWYFFQFAAGKEMVLDVVSANEEFVAIITETKDDKKKYKGGKGIPDFVYRLGSSAKKTKFVRMFDQ